MTAYANIGSNQGDRRSQIEQAVALIAAAFPGCGIRLSKWVESQPWGYDSSNPFLNLGIAIDLDREMADEAILDALLAVERSISTAPHRDKQGGYCDRPIDIDLIAVDCHAVESPKLTLPHPRALQRPFVMEPLHQLAPPSLTEWMRKRLSQCG